MSQKFLLLFLLYLGIREYHMQVMNLQFSFALISAYFTHDRPPNKLLFFVLFD